MITRDYDQLTGVEQQALLLVRELHCQVLQGELSEEFRRPERLAHYLIGRYHGHVQLRMSRIAPGLGVTVRTLQRSFHKLFGKSMRDYQIEVRLNFAQYLLSGNPDLKVSVIAKELGYDDPNDFKRFFRDHAHDSPHAWSEADRARRRKANADSSTSHD